MTLLYSVVFLQQPASECILMHSRIPRSTRSPGCAAWRLKFHKHSTRKSDYFLLGGFQCTVGLWSSLARRAFRKRAQKAWSGSRPPWYAVVSSHSGGANCAAIDAVLLRKSFNQNPPPFQVVFYEWGIVHSNPNYCFHRVKHRLDEHLGNL